MLLHGLASTPKEFALIQHPLRRLGVTLHAPEVAGYSHASLARNARWQDWVAAASAAIARCVPAGQPFVLGGLCAGALLALALSAQRRVPQAAGLALLSPSLSYDGWGLPWWYRFRSLAYLLGLEDHFFMDERPPYGLKNERLRQWVRRQLAGATADATVVGPPRVSLHCVRESERMTARAADWLAAADLPVLAVHARDDEICKFDTVKAIVQRAQNARAELAAVEDSYHMITADNDRQRVVEMLAAHMDACLALVPHAAVPAHAA